MCFYISNNGLSKKVLVVAISAAFFSVGLFAADSYVVSPTATKIINNNSGCFVEPYKGDYSYDKELHPGVSYTQQDISNIVASKGELLPIFSRWQINPTASCAGSTFTVAASAANNPYVSTSSGTYTISNTASGAQITYSSQTPLVDKNYRLNACLLYQPRSSNKSTKYWRSGGRFQVSFINVCKHPVSITPDFIFASSGNLQGLVQADSSSVNLHMGLHYPDVINNNEHIDVGKNTPDYMSEQVLHYSYTKPWNSSVVVLPNASIGVEYYNLNTDQGGIYDTITSPAVKKGNFYVYTKKYSNDKILRFYPDLTSSQQSLPIVDDNYKITLSNLPISKGAVADNLLQLPLVLGASKTAAEKVASTDVIDPAKDIYEHAQALKLQGKSKSGNSQYLWQDPAIDNKLLLSEEPVGLKFKLQEANAAVNIAVSINNKPADIKYALQPNFTVYLASADQSKSVEISTEQKDVATIGDLLPEDIHLTLNTVYYSDPYAGVFYDFVADNPSQILPLSANGTTSVSAVYSARKISKKKISVDLTALTDIAGTANLSDYYLMVTDAEHPEWPATVVNLSRLSTSENKLPYFYVRSSATTDKYNAILVQSSFSAGEQAGKDKFIDTDNDKVLYIDSKLYTALTQISVGKSDSNTNTDTVTFQLQPFHPVFAPFYDPTIDGAPAISSMPKGANITEAFITNMSTPGAECNPYMAGTDIAKNAQALKDSGRDYYLSFGGVSGTMLAAACSQSNLLKAYNTLYNEFNSKHFKGFDFDVEGGALGDEHIRKTMPSTLKLFHALHPNAEIWLTLPVLTDGLQPSALPVLASLANKGAGLTGVSIMTMDYGTANNKMGQAAIDAANAVISQLKVLYPNMPQAKLNSMLVNTPMIGQNDTDGEVFTIADARQLERWAAQKQIGGLRFWSIGRDKPCDKYSDGLPTCNKTGDAKWAFTNILQQVSTPAQPVID